MRPRTLAVLFVVVAALAAFIWFYERHLPSSDEQRELDKKVLRLESEEVTAVVIERGDERVRLERAAAAEDDGGEAAPGAAAVPSSDEWNLVEPLAARADEGLVRGLLDKVSRLERKRELEDAERAAVGLDAPRAELVLETAAGERRLRVGGEIPASSSMVVELVESGEVLVVASGLWSDLERAAGDWRSRDLFPGSMADIERLSWTGASGERLLLAKRGDDYWLESPLVDRADRDAASDLASEIAGLEIGSFIDSPADTADDTGLDPPRAVVEVVIDGRATPFRLELGAPVGDGEGRLYARVDGQVVDVETDLAEQLARPAADWRSLVWTGLETYQIDALELRQGNDAVTVERAGANWRRGGTDEIGFTVVSDLLYALTSAQALRLLEAEEAAAMQVDPNRPQREIVLQGRDREETLRWLGPADGGFVVATSDREPLLLLDVTTADDVAQKIEAVRLAEPLPTGETQGEPAALEGSG